MRLKIQLLHKKVKKIQYFTAGCGKRGHEQWQHKSGKEAITAPLRLIDFSRLPGVRLEHNGIMGTDVLDGCTQSVSERTLIKLMSDSLELSRLQYLLREKAREDRSRRTVNRCFMNC